MRILKLAYLYTNKAITHKSPIRYIIGNILFISGLGRFFTFNRLNYKLKLSPSALTIALWINGNDRIYEEILIGKFLQKDDNFIDIGSNIGTTTISAALALGENGKVICFEPHPRIYSYLQENLRLNKITNVKSYNLALGDNESSLFFSDKFSDDQNEIELTRLEKSIEVKLVKLDSLTENFLNIKLIKIDVEGFEYFVFKGALETLKKTDFILFESHELVYNRFGYSLRDIRNLLDEFEVFRVKDKEMEIFPISDDYISSNCENLLAIKKGVEYSFLKVN